ncbi:zinc finger protein 518B-like [Scyliorhinus canicula]|uniref:zinc finger protein 518B-like n=1 Tax=Scyliorhinus canicula TaxID=7830 RepID=UPI0018F38456|nr:zinc finger protein 518B-like [Scyliorhinus canicula]XP_038647575.1 zinc finger protein 518B-like [Scyliorhinus canicula]XP_038647576.1 zinc finger protein 518B-like [Scyliorhinus canicula]XP_038647577.1 zinc finger protein 518B-like [Scyliorhinus canicula]
MQLKWLKVLLPKLEDLTGKKSFAYSASEVSLKCAVGRKQTARKTIAVKSHLSAKKQQSSQNFRLSQKRIEICDQKGGCGQEINEMLMFCVKCKDIQQFNFAELLEHCQQNHPEDKPVFVCSRCGVTVDDVEQMNVHGLSHKMDRMSIVELSGSKGDLSLPREVELHKTRHLKPNTLYCNKCRFSTKYPLLFQKHILRHEEIQYKCGRCDRVCYTRGEFQRHSVQHTGTFPFKCRYCDYGAVRKDYVVKHTKGVHRDIIKNGGSALVLPMRKGHKKKAFSKPLNIIKVKPPKVTQHENSANVSLHDCVTNSATLTSNPSGTSCQVQDLDLAVLPGTGINSANEDVDKSIIKHVKHLNCSPIDVRKIQLQVLACSKHTVQPGTPLTLVAPAQMVIPSNCLAQLIEIKTVNGKQQLVFKLIPQVSAAGESGRTTHPAQEMQYVDTEMAQPEKNNVSNHSPAPLTKIVDHNELACAGPLNEVVDVDQNNMGINTKMLFSNPHSSFDVEPMGSNSSVLESRNKGSPKQNRNIIVEQPQYSEPTETNLTCDSQNGAPLASPDIVGEVTHYLHKGAFGSKTTMKDLSADTREILNQIDKESLMFSESKETLKSTNTYLTSEVATSKGRGSISKGDQSCVPRFNKGADINFEATFEKSFVQLPKSGERLPNKNIHLCDSHGLIGSSCKTAIKLIESLPNEGSKENTQHCITSSCKPLDICKASPCQLSPTSSSNDTIAASKSSDDHPITLNCSSAIIPKDIFDAEYLKCQCASIVDKGPSNSEACQSTFESHSMCSAAVQTCSNASASTPDQGEVNCVSNSYCTLGKCEHSRTKPDLPHQQLNKSKHQINANDNDMIAGESTSQDIEINTDFGDCSNQCDLDNDKDKQWPIISSVFSLSCGTNNLPDSIQWDNDQENNCTSFTSTQEILKTDLCSQTQESSKSFTLPLEKKEHTSESFSHKNPVCLQMSKKDLSTTSCPPVVNGNLFQLSSGVSFTKCLSLFPPLAPVPPVSFVEIPGSSANQFQQLVDDAHVVQLVDNAHAFDAHQSSASLSSGLSPTSNNNTAVQCCTQMHSFVQKMSNNVPSITGNPLTGLTQNNQTKSFSLPPKNVFPNLSSVGVPFQNKSFEYVLPSAIDGVDEPSVSHIFSEDVTLVTSTPSGLTSNVFKQQISTINQLPVALTKIFKANSNSTGLSFFHQDIYQSSEKLQEETATTNAPSLKVCLQPSLQSKVSLFPSSCNSVADPKNGNCTDAAEKLKCISTSLGKTVQLPEKVKCPSTAKLQNTSLSTSPVVDNQSNHTKVQLNYSNKTSKTHPCIHKAEDDASSQSEEAVDFVNPKSEMTSCCLSAFPFCSTKSHVNLENTPPPDYLVQDTDCAKHETTYKVVPSGIVLRVLNAADDYKQKASSGSYQSVNQSQNLTPVSCSTSRKSEMRASVATKKQKVRAKPNSINCSSKVRCQEKSNQDQSSNSVDRANTCNTISVKTAARQKPRTLKSSAGVPLKRKNTRKREPDHAQDDIPLEKVRRQDSLIPVVSNDDEVFKTARKLRLKPFSESQLVKCPRRNQPVVVLNHPDVDVQEVANVMQTIGKYRGHVLKVVLSERTVISLNLKEKHQRQEFENGGILLDKWYNCKVVSPVKERHMLKMKLKKIHKNNYQIVKNVHDEHLQYKFHCWFCGRMFSGQEEWIAHGQRHLMEATRDWNDVATIQEITENEAE